MANNKHHYRITVTPIETDGVQCQGRCTIEFQHNCDDNWMGILEAAQRTRGFTGDERAALVVGTQLLRGLMLQRHNSAEDTFAALRPHLDEFIRDLNQRGTA